MMKNKIIQFILMLTILVGCQNTQERTVLEKREFGRVDGEVVDLYVIKFPGKLKAEVTNYGGIVTALRIPDRNGVLEDIVLGYDALEGYLAETPYFGALIGRYGNRIARGTFSIDNEAYALATNNGLNHLHGGLKGFDKVIWDVISTSQTEDSAQLIFKYVSPDGEEGYPGTVTCFVAYEFTPKAFRISYEATTDKATVINLTQHSYFNLSGNVSDNILDHSLHINATEFLPVDSTLIPTGEIRSVTGTPFDFTRSKKIGLEINDSNQQLIYGLGYDHCWVLEGGQSSEMRKVASLYYEKNGRLMDVYTTEPGIQFYSGNFLDGSITGKAGVVYAHRSGLCLETQHFPDAPNQQAFPSTVLRPGGRYATETQYVFSTQ